VFGHRRAQAPVAFAGRTEQQLRIDMMDMVVAAGRSKASWWRQECLGASATAAPTGNLNGERIMIDPNRYKAEGKTLIHVFPTNARTQQDVLSLLRRMIAAVFAPQAGFVASALAQSADGQRIVLQSEWSGLADFRSALRTPLGLAYWQRVRALLARGDNRATDVHVYDDLPSFYSLGVVTTHSAPPAHTAPIAANVV
jgi:hypothetical protein